MKTFEGKTLDDAIENACQELGVSLNELHYTIIEEKKSLFNKKVVIECYYDEMIEEFMSDYIRRLITDMGFEIETVTYKQDGRFYCTIDTDNNSILIGKNGVILRALNFIVKNAVNTQFKEKIEISVDINGYKESRYRKVTAMSKRIGRQVQRTKVAVKLDPMPADERKVMHQTIAAMDHLKTESKGEGANRYITISYVD